MPRSYACTVCGKSSEQSRCARHRLGGAPRGNSFEPTRMAVAARDGWTCQICGAAIVDRDGLHIDHVKARSTARTPAEAAALDQPSNLRATCSDCNLRKGDR